MKKEDTVVTHRYDMVDSEHLVASLMLAAANVKHCNEARKEVYNRLQAMRNFPYI